MDIQSCHFTSDGHSVTSPQFGQPAKPFFSGAVGELSVKFFDRDFQMSFCQQIPSGDDRCMSSEIGGIVDGGVG
jgi:hypothetical protein